ncbi:hypothetical protein CLF_112215 [Clonorchis sinensis]|uniref:Uncharacterized protein n=1 Tax=Clonorchis sinensis TaxID=79923 RepID=G7YVZ8_CLOSI|nr:hypothetical protein CLF_112215 [Clonorchis sinensis]
MYITVNTNQNKRHRHNVHIRLYESKTGFSYNRHYRTWCVSMQWFSTQLALLFNAARESRESRVHCALGLKKDKIKLICAVELVDHIRPRLAQVNNTMRVGVVVVVVAAGSLMVAPVDMSMNGQSFELVHARKEIEFF